ncbi:MAG: haloacid dehalogenase type II, partial [Acidobacteria bacterium]|nr:haloacid dehalogenase type II [Acidobacteriota bacterium]
MKTPEWITFDCYGTLIDWESGAREVFAELASLHHLTISPQEVFDRWEAIQFRMIQGSYRRYREILRESLGETLRELGANPTEGDCNLLADRLPTWKPFVEVPGALKRLKSRSKLGIISNIDNDFIAATVPQLGVTFDAVITAEQAQAYKPNPAPFQLALEKLGAAPSAILHTAFGFRYDLGLAHPAPTSKSEVSNNWPSNLIFKESTQNHDR